MILEKFRGSWASLASFSGRPQGPRHTPVFSPPGAEPFLGRELVLSPGCISQSPGDVKHVLKLRPYPGALFSIGLGLGLGIGGL